MPDHAWQLVLTTIVTRHLTDLTAKTEFGTLGEGPVVVEVDGYELWRAFFGRRSREQMESWNWSTPYPVEKAAFFPPRATDLAE